MDSERSRVITGRVFRAGQTPPPDTEWADCTPEERIEAVWTLTVLCLAWNQEDFIEPRLDKSVVRIQRAEGLSISELCLDDPRLDSSFQRTGDLCTRRPFDAHPDLSETRAVACRMEPRLESDANVKSVNRAG